MRAAESVGGARRSDAWPQILRALGFAGALLAITSGVRLATAWGLVDDPDAFRRGTMVVVGAFFLSVGNRLPKTLTPLAAMRCNPARVQAFQRAVGRQWVIAGLVFIAIWVQVPLALARPLSIALLSACIAATVWQLVRLRAGR
jgi:Ca2+/Na+ antiporter